MGIIGAGVQGRVLIQDAIKIAGVRFKAVCDIWSYSRRYASRRLKAMGHEVNVYDDYRDMLAKEENLDAVIVAAPDFVHAEQTVACLEAGKHVYCEKEMSNKLENAAAIVRAAGKAGKLVQIGHQRRSNPIYREVRRLLREDRLCGRVTTCYGQWSRGVQPKLTWPERYLIPDDVLKKYGYENMDQFRNWRWYKRYSGGPIADLGSHQIDIFDWFLDSHPHAIAAMGGADYFADREWYEDVMVLYDYLTEQQNGKGSARAFYQVLNTSSYGHYYERFSGDGGSVTISEDPRRCAYVAEHGNPQPAWMEGVERVPMDGHFAVPLVPALARKSAETKAAVEEAEQKNVHQLHLENFFAAVRTGKKSMLNCPPEDGYATAVAVLNAIPAIEKGRIEIPAADYEVKG